MARPRAILRTGAARDPATGRPPRGRRPPDRRVWRRRRAERDGVRDGDRAVPTAGWGGEDEEGGGAPATAPAPSVGPAAPATLALAFPPNAVPAPIYAAGREGFDRRHGVRLRIREPGSSPNSLALLTSGR